MRFSRPEFVTEKYLNTIPSTMFQNIKNSLHLQYILLLKESKHKMMGTIIFTSPFYKLRQFLRTKRFLWQMFPLSLQTLFYLCVNFTKLFLQRIKTPAKNLPFNFTNNLLQNRKVKFDKFMTWICAPFAVCCLPTRRQFFVQKAAQKCRWNRHVLERKRHLLSSHRCTFKSPDIDIDWTRKFMS